MTPDDTSIERISAWVVALPLNQRFASARTGINERKLVLIRVESDSCVGWGEAAPVPGHSVERISTLWESLNRLITDRGLASPTAASGMLAAAFIEATDDLAARLTRSPLWSRLGGGNEVEASAAIGVDREGRPDAHQLLTAAESGYRHVKLKITPLTRAHDVAAPIAEYPALSFAADANGTLGFAEKDLLAALDDLGLAYIEQPGPPADLGFHVRLRQQLATPIALDESAHSPAAIDTILSRNAADIVNLKAGRFGTSAALRLAKRIAAAGLRVRLGGLLESGVGRAHSVALASHPLFDVVGDVAGSDRYFSDDLVRPQWRISDGRLPLPAAPGIGVDVDEDAVAKHTVDSLSIS